MVEMHSLDGKEEIRGMRKEMQTNKKIGKTRKKLDKHEQKVTQTYKRGERTNVSV